MKPNDRQELIRLLTLYHMEQKSEAACRVEKKVHEECAEVLLEQLAGNDSRNEETDLLMCLVEKIEPNDILRWEEKLVARNRIMLDNQRDYYDMTFGQLNY